MTQKTYESLKTELESCKTEKRKEIAYRMQVAREQGDLAENADYDLAREDQSANEARIKEIESMLSGVSILDEEVASGTAGIGMSVTLREVGEKEDETFHIVDISEVSSLQNKISIESPIGRAINKHKKGDTVSVLLPSGAVIQYMIVGISKNKEGNK